ncbi:hypothetical protein G6O69_20560 [Pseudenhygromyxa sp. WMMC2535]|uniref:hypothetical protein n=1 Tax=Pseudenhygromyxa sp. WMMC2535 TaxID=2712867 RepID=UPI0015526248|nr:hypothetical protein [Pseudenhygromyxa sp. WMMC2535]NVB40247.1 hypothetical protein [Pseudenhygromyxa sp. WMMC2535]
MDFSALNAWRRAASVLSVALGLGCTMPNGQFIDCEDTGCEVAEADTSATEGSGESEGEAGESTSESGEDSTSEDSSEDTGESSSEDTGESSSEDSESDDATEDSESSTGTEDPLGDDELLPDIAGCVGLDAIDAAGCAAEDGTIMVVDADGIDDEQTIACMRFSFSDNFEPAAPTQVELQLHSASLSTAASSSSGAVWVAEPFDALEPGGPELKEEAVATDQGFVDVDVDVNWPLPAELVEPGSSLHLCVVSEDTNNVQYWNLDGEIRPRLIVN